MLFSDADVEVEQARGIDEDDHLVEHMDIKLSENEVAACYVWIVVLNHSVGDGSHGEIRVHDK